MSMNKKVTYSKWIPLATFAVFLVVLWFSFNAETSDYSDANIYVTAITASAGCFTGSVIWYMKKAQRENVYKLQMELYRTQAALELENLEKRLKLEKKYHASIEDIDRQRMDSQLDEMKQETLEGTQAFLNDEKTDVNSAPEFSG